MKKKLTALALSGLMICSLSISALAAPVSVDRTGTESAEPAPLADSQLYYGEVKDILTDEEGTLTGLWMESPKSGEYVMKLSEETYWIDSGERTASDPATLKVGERLYVFHSSVSTRSLPPQTAAYAVVRNIPQDVGCAQYHEVEAVEETDEGVRITTDNGGLILSLNKDTTLLSYNGDAPENPADIPVGSHIMAWYQVVLESFPGQAHPSHVMTLEAPVSREPMTRTDLAVLLHEAQGSPVVNFAMDYSDLAQDAPCAEAFRWAASQNLINGYADGRVGPEDVLTREQLVVILWRQAGSPMLMDYPGLARYSDVGDISRFAQPALAWAHQKGLVPAEGRLGPWDGVTLAEAQEMLQTLTEEQ